MNGMQRQMEQFLQFRSAGTRPGHALCASEAFTRSDCPRAAAARHSQPAQIIFLLECNFPRGEFRISLRLTSEEPSACDSGSARPGTPKFRSFPHHNTHSANQFQYVFPAQRLVLSGRSDIAHFFSQNTPPASAHMSASWQRDSRSSADRHRFPSPSPSSPRGPSRRAQLRRNSFAR